MSLSVTWEDELSKMLLRRAYLALFSLFFLSSCGLDTGPGIPSDPIPQGTVVAQGPFTDLNQSVSGTVVVYLTQGQGYVIRLTGLQAPAENTLQLVGVSASEGEVYWARLGVNVGTKNYYTGRVVPTTWTSVIIRSTVAPPGVRDYGQAILTPVP